MIRPVAFRMNEQTAVNNYYQHEIDNVSERTVQDRALEEFDAFVEKLRALGVRVIVVDDNLEQDTPDSIFPNNWVSFHADGRVVECNTTLPVLGLLHVTLPIKHALFIESTNIGMWVPLGWGHQINIRWVREQLMTRLRRQEVGEDTP